MLPYYRLVQGAFPDRVELSQERKDALHRCSNLAELAACVQETTHLDIAEIMTKLLCHLGSAAIRNSHDLECALCSRQTSDCVMLYPCGHIICRACIQKPTSAAYLRTGTCICEECPIMIENYLDCGLFTFMDQQRDPSASPGPPGPPDPPDIHHRNDVLLCPQSIQAGTYTFTDHKMLDASESILSHYRLATPETREALRLYSDLRYRGLVSQPHLRLLVTSERTEPGPRCRWAGRLSDLFAHLACCPYHEERCVCGFSHFRFVVEGIHAPNCPELHTECPVCGTGGIPQVRIFDHSVSCLLYNAELEKRVDRLENAVARFSTAIGKWSLSHQQSAMDHMVGMGAKEPRRRRFRINKTLYFHLKKLFFTNLLLISVLYVLFVYLYQLLQKYLFPSAYRVASLVILVLTSLVLLVASLVAIDTLIRQMGGRYVTKYMFEVYLGMMILYGVLYGMVANVRSGAFTNIPDGTADNANYVMLSLFYYSAVVISKFGFGEVAPTEPLGRLFVTTEAMWGIYLCIILFRGMSFFIQTTSLEDSLHAMISNFFTMAREVPSLIEALNDAPRKRAAALAANAVAEDSAEPETDQSGAGPARSSRSSHSSRSPHSSRSSRSARSSSIPTRPPVPRVTPRSSSIMGDAQTKRPGSMEGETTSEPTGSEVGRVLFIQAISHDDDEEQPYTPHTQHHAGTGYHPAGPQTRPGPQPIAQERESGQTGEHGGKQIPRALPEEKGEQQVQLAEESIGSDVRMSRSNSQPILSQGGPAANGMAALWPSVGEGLGKQ